MRMILIGEMGLTKPHFLSRPRYPRRIFNAFEAIYVNKYNPCEFVKTFLVLINEVRRRDQTSVFSPVAFQKIMFYL